MRETSVSCRRRGRNGQRTRAERGLDQHGFTLLELLVVMALVALVTGIAAPSALRQLKSAKERGLVSDVEAALSALPAEAFTAGAVLEVDETALRRRLPELPQDWVLVLPKPLLYGSNGVAVAGAVEMRAPGGESVTWKIAAFDGAVTRHRP